MTTVFVPPVSPGRPLWAKPGHPASSLFRHYAPHSAGQNVWLLDDLTVTLEQPWNDAGVRRTFLGGHIHTVDATEQAALIAAGFTLTTYDFPTSTPLPGTPDPEEPGDLDPVYGLSNHFDLDAIFDTARYA